MAKRNRTEEWRVVSGKARAQELRRKKAAAKKKALERAKKVRTTKRAHTQPQPFNGGRARQHQGKGKAPQKRNVSSMKHLLEEERRLEEEPAAATHQKRNRAATSVASSRRNGNVRSLPSSSSNSIQPKAYDARETLVRVQAMARASIDNVSDEIVKETVSLFSATTPSAGLTEGVEVEGGGCVEPLGPVLVSVYGHMMKTFQQPRSQQKYGFCEDSGDSELAEQLLADHSHVPSYFANVHDSSIWRRKYQSLAGLRNLLEHGPTIYDQLRDKGFIGYARDYHSGKGLQFMRHITGNVVDLDTTVLRCSDRLAMEAINASNKLKGLAQYENTGAFGQSEQSQEIAIECSRPLLEDFATKLGINGNAALLAERRIDIDTVVSSSSSPIPRATNNEDRGKWPIWRYTNVGQDSFHANVPTMSDVNGALLKAPVQCAKHWLFLHALFGGDVKGEVDTTLQRHLDDFFEHCVSDSCFNGKWKAIEEYGTSLAHQGTIVDVLQRTQARHQDIFTAKFFEMDDEQTRTNEIAEMTRLVCTDGRLCGRDGSGAVRRILPDDVKLWVSDPSIVL